MKVHNMNAGNGNTRTRNDEEEDEDVIFQEIATNQSEVTVLYFRCNDCIYRYCIGINKY